MTRLRRKLGLALLLSAAATTGAAAPTPVPVTAVGGADVQDFQEGVELLKRGRKAEALAAFQRALAADPSNEDAYELWKSTDQEIFLDMLLEGGEFEKIAKRFMERATLGRVERRNDPSAIGDLVNRLRGTSDAMERKRIIRQLSADHGEYAVPRLIQPLADAGDDDWRVVAMHTLTEMDTDVVLPLIAALETDDAYQRANIALVLGYIGDPRAAAPLAALASSDGDGKVTRAAQSAAERCGATGDVLGMFLQLGEDYHFRRDRVLRPFDYSAVLWSWEEGGLTSRPVPRAIYNNELSKRAYYSALELDPASLDALAGIARASTDVAAKLIALDAAGEDVGELLELAEAGSVAVAAAGVAAIDRALYWSVIADDGSTGVRLSRTLADLAAAPTEGLRAALDSSDGGMSGEAAVALGRIAARSGADPGAEVVSALGANASREVVRIAAVIDGDAARAEVLVRGLGDEGVLVNHRGSGAQGIALMRRLPGVDVIVVGDVLPDLTLDQVLSDIARNVVTAETPVFLATADEELADSYADRVTGVLASPSDLSPLAEVFEASLEGDRAAADDLSRRSAEVLAQLARAGNASLASILDDLTAPLAHRDDAVTVPVMAALAAAGTPDQTAPLAAVVADESRSDEARVAAGDALAAIFGRHSVPAGAAAGLREVVSSDASLAVRSAAARALGSANLPAEMRAELVREARVDVAGGGMAEGE